MAEILSLLERERLRAKKEAQDLLWENIEQSYHWFGKFKLNEPELSKTKLSIQYDHYHPTLVLLHTSFSGTIVHLETNDIQNILQFGAARRISAIYRNANRLCKIVYPERVGPLSQDESGDISDFLLVIYVHMIGVMDAFAIALKRLAGSSLTTAEKHSDILSEKFRRSVGFESLESMFAEYDDWFRRVKEDLRNRFVHKVPPYVSPAVLGPDDATEHQRLEESLSEAMKNGEWAKLSEIREKQGKLGKFFPYISFIDSNEHTPLLPTLLDDLFRFQVVTLTIFEELVSRLNFQSK